VTLGWYVAHTLHGKVNKVLVHRENSGCMEYGLIMNIKFPIRCTGLSVDESNLKHLRKEFNENTNTSKT
jgi:hypothetical protein